MESRKIKTALASFGMSGKVFHGPLLHVHDGFEISKILERNRSESNKRYPSSQIVRKYADIITDKNIELVIINTPDHIHYEMTKHALEAGKHVVVEKPFTLKYAEADELIKIAKKKKRLLSVFQNRRWDSDFLTVQKVIKNKLLGRLVEYEAHFDRYRTFIQDNWKEDASVGTGTLYNLGSHLIDQALVLFGFPQWVFADVRHARKDSKVDDAFDIRLGYPEVRVTLKASYLVREPGPKYILHGEQGSFHKYGMDIQEEELKKGRWPKGDDWGEEPENWYGHLTTHLNESEFNGKIKSENGCYMAYYDSIYDHLTKGRKIAVTAEQGRDIVQVIEAAYASARGKNVIKF